jgi:hypothetical protein
LVDPAAGDKMNMQFFAEAISKRELMPARLFFGNLKNPESKS